MTATIPTIDELEATKHRRLNVGAGNWPLAGFTNLDADATTEPDICAMVPPLPFPDESLDAIYCGHFLEHLDYETGQDFLRECHRCLIPGGQLGVVVPDTREVMTRWLRGDIDHISLMGDMGLTYWPIADLDAICSLFLYSTIQDSPHRHSYDLGTLQRALRSAGFRVVSEINRYTDPRISTGQWYQCGLDAVKPRGGSDA